MSHGAFALSNAWVKFSFLFAQNKLPVGMDIHGTTLQLTCFLKLIVAILLSLRDGWEEFMGKIRSVEDSYSNEAKILYICLIKVSINTLEHILLSSWAMSQEDFSIYLQYTFYIPSIPLPYCSYLQRENNCAHKSKDSKSIKKYVFSL